MELKMHQTSRYNQNEEWQPALACAPNTCERCTTLRQCVKCLLKPHMWCTHVQTTMCTYCHPPLRPRAQQWSCTWFAFTAADSGCSPASAHLYMMSCIWSTLLMLRIDVPDCCSWNVDVCEMNWNETGKSLRLVFTSFQLRLTVQFASLHGDYQNVQQKGVPSSLQWLFKALLITTTAIECKLYLGTQSGQALLWKLFSIPAAVK